MIKIFSFLLLMSPFFWTIKAPEASVWDDLNSFQEVPGWIDKEEKLQCFTPGVINKLQGSGFNLSDHLHLEFAISVS